MKPQPRMNSLTSCGLNMIGCGCLLMLVIPLFLFGLLAVGAVAK